MRFFAVNLETRRTMLILLIPLIASLTWGWGRPATSPDLGRIESRVDFQVDDAFLKKGGVQLFFELISSNQNAEDCESFRQLRPLDREDLWSRRKEPLYVLASRLVFEVDKDISFFSEGRVCDESYLNRLLPSYQIKKLDSKIFHSGAAPQNTFEIQYFGPGLAPPELARLGRGFTNPDVVLLQHNYAFEKILGFKTALMGRTLTLHFQAGTGRTRVAVWSLSYLQNIPPFFLGGAARVTREAWKKSSELIARLRDFQDSWSVR